MITKRLSRAWFLEAYDSGVRNGKISLSGEFMITPIFSGQQLREPKIRLHATLTVNTKLARAMLHFSIRLVSRTISLSLSRLNIVIMSSGIGSCRSRITFAPSAFGINRSEEHTSELQSPCNLVCRLLLEKKKKKKYS